MNTSTIVKINGINFQKSSESRIRRCVGVAKEKEKILMTNTKGGQPILSFTFEEWDAFIKGAKAGEFDTYL